MRIKSGILLILILGLCQLPACKKSGGKKVITSTDDRFEITVPAGWTQEYDLHDEAQLQATHRLSNQFLLVIAEEKEDFDKISLREYCNIVLDGMHQKLRSPSETEPIELVIDHDMAFQRELTGIMDYIKIIYLHTCLESPTHFYQIIAWTTPSKYPKHEKTFKKITQYFREKNRGQIPSSDPTRDTVKGVNPI